MELEEEVWTQRWVIISELTSRTDPGQVGEIISLGMLGVLPPPEDLKEVLRWGQEGPDISAKAA